MLAVRKGDEHTKSYPMIRLGFSRVTLPDGRSFPLQASLGDLGSGEYVNSEGVASTRPPTKDGDIGVPMTASADGAGACIGVGILPDLAAHSAQWYDFKLKHGRKAWLRLHADLVLAAPGNATAPNMQDAAQGAKQNGTRDR